MIDKVRVFSTFTGIGSIEMAMRNVGLNYESVGVSEVDRYALLSFDAIHNADVEVDVPTKDEIVAEFERCNIAYNFSTGKSEIPKSIKQLEELYVAHKRSKNFGDIRLINERELPDFDLFTYSFPCKDISVAGAQRGFIEGSQTQSSLLWECGRIIEYKKPKYLLMENVKNLVGKNHIDNFNQWIDVLDGLGYNSYWKVLNGRDYGVPQNRERVMMVSILKEYDTGYEFPKKIPLDKCINDILEVECDVPQNLFIKPSKYKHLLDRLIQKDVSYCIDANYHKGTSVDNYLNKSRRQLVICREVNRRLNELGVRCDYDKSIPRTKRLEPRFDKISGTITTVQKDNLLLETTTDDIRVRRLSPLECWRLMGYSDKDFYKTKDAGLSNTKLYERAGRGIVVPMLEGILRELFNV